MPQQRKPPRLWLRTRAGRQSTWVILDEGREYRTSCGASDREGAEKALADHIAAKYTPTRERVLSRLAIADVMTVYLREHAPTVARPDFLAFAAAPILDWWGDKTLAVIRGKTCRAYAAWRGNQGVGNSTIRNELATLRAAIRYYHREYGPLDAVPMLTLPDKASARDRWLTRSEAARLLRAARRHPRLARFILIGLYTGTRRDAILSLRWIPSVDAGYVDLDGGLIYRQGRGQRSTHKRRPPCPIPVSLRPHLERWSATDLARGWVDVCHYDGAPAASIKKAWGTARVRSGLGPDVTPHTLRHTCATWLMHRGVPIAEAAGFLGMSVQTFEAVYGHHHPDHMSRAASRP